MQSDTTPPRGRFLSVSVPKQTDDREALTILIEACDRALPLLEPGTKLHRGVQRARWAYGVYLDLPPVRPVPNRSNS